MSVQQIIKEAMNKNPIAFEEALKEELSARIALALEAKMNGDDEMDDDDEDDMDDQDDDKK